MTPHYRQAGHGPLEMFRYSATVPITNGMMSAGPIATAPLGSEGGQAPAPAANTSAPGHNTALHTGLLLLGAGFVIAGLHLGGWRLAFDVGMGRG